MQSITRYTLSYYANFLGRVINHETKEKLCVELIHPLISKSIIIDSKCERTIYIINKQKRLSMEN